MAKKKPGLKAQLPLSNNQGRAWRDALRLELARADGPTGTALERIARIVVHDALNGDYIAINEIANRIDGKVAVQENTGGEEPISKLIVKWEGPAAAGFKEPGRIIEHSPVGTTDASFRGSAERGMLGAGTAPVESLTPSKIEGLKDE